ncbi:hypothetical protein MHM84_03635 [Halomonas sp. McH1-25]|uniref:hypothetical protein n=1 Tax=unclassified Halomonas TaxID=2609666 RepID=UPI001EF4A351|nr:MULTISPECIES: hypothetical protein [unclassified Halomonas]MCG7598864.1 hypothetical protein [Halomonas sp. McH1-25]MCP1340827.1 hypothetical protein [Halomonas sp. FL8]MCP1361290.1 hypothetical protein [Halomonas sp. BBD45]MCP1363683.1 hypothetical protein [Halomonas sp. BBD48]
MKRIALLALLLLAGCASIKTPIDADYQFGDTTGSLLALQHDYCVEGDMIARQLLLMSARALIPDYPPSGLCTDLIEVLSDASNDQQ